MEFVMYGLVQQQKKTQVIEIKNLFLLYCYNKSASKKLQNYSTISPSCMILSVPYTVDLYCKVNGSLKMN